jgi:putative OPT family oligopeptide transporter
VPDRTGLRDFSVRALVVGCLFGALFGMANAYLGLRVGLTISTAIPLAVISVAVFRGLERVRVFRGSGILEHNIAQTTGSASSSLASGLIFTIPALFLWGLSPSMTQVVVLGMLGATLGILFMIPLRQFLIVKEHKVLPYPEGTASAEVLIAADAGGGRAKMVFYGLGVGAAYKFVLAFLHAWADKVNIPMPGLKKGYLGIEPTPALLGVGYILGYRIAAIMVAGGLVSSLALIPLIAHFGDTLQVPMFPATEVLIRDMTAGQIWKNYVKYIGAGAVAAAGIITVIKALPTMWSALRVGVGELRRSGPGVQEGPASPRTQRDLPFAVLLVGVAVVVAVVIFTPFVMGGGVGNIALRAMAAACITVCAFAFVTVSSRIVGMVGVSSNPTSGMTIVTLLITSGIFYALGWTDITGKATALTVGTVVCVSASIAGDISQDLKAGYIIGATPARQQASELVGGLFAALPVAAAVLLLGNQYGFGSDEIPAPQATLMKTVIEGVLAADLPWGLVLTGAAFALVAELLSVPSLPFAVGIYLPLSTMTPVFVGGVIRWGVELLSRLKEEREAREARKAREVRKESGGLLFSSGLIAGEGLMGVLVALYAFIMATKPAGLPVVFVKPWGQVVSLIGFAGLGYLLVAAARRRSR